VYICRKTSESGGGTQAIKSGAEVINGTVNAFGNANKVKQGSKCE